MDADDTTFRARWRRYSPELAEGIRGVYGDRADEVLGRVETLVRAAFDSRPPELRDLDEERLLQPDWLQLPSRVGYVCYADRFAGDLAGVASHVNHLERLGVTYLHLMPLLRPREGANDGGYAVADYRQVRSDLGTMADLATLARTLRARGISLVVDLVLNHVAREHEWAVRARAGEARYRDYFYHYPDRQLPDAWEQTLPEVFPDFAPGNFTHDDALGWVWTTFNDYQWDVNWSNPEVFCEYLDIILFLANQGVEVVRLDAIAFIWKELLTTCQNRPQVHSITQALRAAARIAAPALAFKAEAIVAPDDLIGYFGRGRHHGKVSDLAYHNVLMAHLWSALASRDTRLLRNALDNFPAKPPTATWGTYARCHDDIGWAITDVEAEQAGLNGFSHRAFLSDFYSGLRDDSWANGLVFQANPATGDRRISGALASLAGLEQASDLGDEGLRELAIGRINLLHAIICGFGGVPLIYSGDEIAMTNDYGFTDSPAHAEDNRWVHRPCLDWDAVARLDEPGLASARVFAWLRRVIEVRKQLPMLHAGYESTACEAGDPRLLLLLREHPEGNLVQLYNMSEQPVPFSLGTLRFLLGRLDVDEHLGGHRYDLRPDSMLVRPYQALWFA